MQLYLTQGPFYDHTHALDCADWLERRGFAVTVTRKLGKDGKARSTVRAYRQEEKGNATKQTASRI